MLLGEISCRSLAAVVGSAVGTNVAKFRHDENTTLPGTNGATGLFGRTSASGTADSVLGRRLLDVEFALIDLRAVLCDLLGEDGTLDPHRRDVDAEHIDHVVAVHLE